jgi:Sec-independent protein translocase protein TatA
MQLLGIGPLEVLLIAVIAVIVLGPKGMVSGAREVGKAIRKVIKSPIWTEIVDTSREIREFPRKLAREAGIEKDIEDLRKSAQGTAAEINQMHIPNISPIEDQTDIKKNANASDDIGDKKKKT